MLFPYESRFVLARRDIGHLHFPWSNFSIPICFFRKHIPYCFFFEQVFGGHFSPYCISLIHFCPFMKPMKKPLIWSGRHLEQKMSAFKRRTAVGVFKSGRYGKYSCEFRLRSDDNAPEMRLYSAAKKSLTCCRSLWISVSLLQPTERCFALRPSMVVIITDFLIYTLFIPRKIKCSWIDTIVGSTVRIESLVTLLLSKSVHMV